MPEVTVPKVTAPSKPAVFVIEMKCLEVSERILQAQVVEDGGLHACMRDGYVADFVVVLPPSKESHPSGAATISGIGVCPFKKGVHYRVEFIP